MTRKRLLVALAAVAALFMGTLVVANSAAAGNFGERISGNFVDVAVDSNGDGFTANYFSGAAQGSGSPAYEGVVEIAFPVEPIDCGVAGMEGDVVAYSMVRRYGNGDLLYSRLIDGSLCFDPGGTTTLTVEAEFFDGTGRHQDATGSYTVDFVVDGLLPDTGGGVAHAAFYGESFGVLD